MTCIWTQEIHCLKVMLIFWNAKIFTLREFLIILRYQLIILRSFFLMLAEMGFYICWVFFSFLTFSRNPSSYLLDILFSICRVRWWCLMVSDERSAPGAPRRPPQPSALPLPLPYSSGEQPQGESHDCLQSGYCFWTQCLSVRSIFFFNWLFFADFLQQVIKKT